MRRYRSGARRGLRKALDREGSVANPGSEVQERDCSSWRRGHAASNSIRSVTNCIVSARTQGPIPDRRRSSVGSRPSSACPSAATVMPRPSG
jgi:hypothetical protein